MKKILIYTLLMTFSFGLKGQQIEFDTYLAFEDAAGRRDTV